MTFGLRKIDRYLLTEIAGPFIGGVVFFLFVFLMFQVIRLAEIFILHGVSAAILLKITGYMTLSFLPMSLPVAFLIAVLVGFGRLSADSELVALKAGGLSLLRLTAPVGAVALLIVALSFMLNLEWVPKGDRALKSLLIRVSNTKVVSSIKEGTFTTGFFDLLIYTDRIDVDTNRMDRVFIYDERDPQNPLTVVAREGEFVSVRTDSELASAAMLRLYDGSIHKNELGRDSYERIGFREYKLFLKVDEGDDTHQTKPKMYAWRELGQKIAEQEPGSHWHRELRAELARRYAVALSPLLFVFLGVGFGTVRTRSVRAGALLIALIVTVSYWGLQLLGTVLAKQGVLPPHLAMQIPNAVMMILAVTSFRAASW